jgi:chromate transporter
MDTPWFIIEVTTIRELAILLLKLGFTAFGGPAAHIALMHAEVVKRRKWLDERHFLDLLGATQLRTCPTSIRCSAGR